MHAHALPAEASIAAHSSADWLSGGERRSRLEDAPLPCEGHAQPLQALALGQGSTAVVETKSRFHPLYCERVPQYGSQVSQLLHVAARTRSGVVVSCFPCQSWRHGALAPLVSLHLHSSRCVSHATFAVPLPTASPCPLPLLVSASPQALRSDARSPHAMHVPMKQDLRKTAASVAAAELAAARQMAATRAPASHARGGRCAPATC